MRRSRNGSGSSRERPSADRNVQLLRDVDLYKVGHHGSRNATPRASLYPLWAKDRRRNLNALCSTYSGAYRRTEQVPDPDLVAALSKRPFVLRRTPDEKPSKERAWALTLSARAQSRRGFQQIE